MSEKKLSRYIDELNAGKRPKEHKNGFLGEEIEEQKLFETVRKVRLLRDIEYPDQSFQRKLMNTMTKNEKLGKYRTRKKALIYSTVAVAAAILLLTTTSQFLPNKDIKIVYAMENALKEIQAYHGLIEISETNELGETMTQSKREVWVDKSGSYYIKELEGSSRGLITVNNGEQKWQLCPEEKMVYYLPSFPDPYRLVFELGNEIKDVRKALRVKIIGMETISGRKATKLEITPDGGVSYFLWVDNETDLPLKKVSAMNNAIQINVEYTMIELINEIPRDLLKLDVPNEYEVLDNNTEQVVTSFEEAEELVGFRPKFQTTTENGYFLDRIAVEKENNCIRLYYKNKDVGKTILISQRETRGDLEANSSSILGRVNGYQAQIINTESVGSIRWKEGDMEYFIQGDDAMEIIKSLAENLSGGEVVIPESEERFKEPQIKVEVDLSVVENEQKSVDAGHSPWRLDPAFVTQVFASLLLSPEGILGDYPIAYENIEIIFNNGIDAIAEIKDKNSIAKYVYLQRLVRQDDTGIWTVIGYDPIN